MQQHVIAETLEEIHDVRRRVRSDLQAFWFPLVLFGTLTLVSAAVVARAGGEALAVYWPIAGAAGAVLTGWHYYHHERRTGLEGPAAPYILTAAAILFGTTLAGWLGSESGSELAPAVAPTLVVSAGYVVFAWLERSGALGVLASVLALLTIVVTLSGTEGEPAAVILALASGAASLGTGLACRLRRGPGG